MTYEAAWSHVEETPEWEVTVMSFLKSINPKTSTHGAFDETMAKGMMRHFCLMLTEDGSVANTGEIQKRLRERHAVAQLIAKPFEPETMPTGVRCIDVASGESRDYYLDVAVGPGEIVTQFKAEGLSHGLNETLLAYITGMLVEPIPAGDVRTGSNIAGLVRLANEGFRLSKI